MIIKEYSMLDDGSNPYYPINDERNQNLILKYREEVKKLKHTIVSGRLGEYKYYDMHDTINHALEVFDELGLENVKNGFQVPLKKGAA